MKFFDRFKRKPQPESAADSSASSAGGGSAAPTGPTITKVGSDIVIALGEFLHRIPPNLLEVGPHAMRKEARFDMVALEQRINSGETTLNLAEIYRQIPEIFRSEIRDEDNIQLHYPWRKVIAVITEGRPSAPVEIQPAKQPVPIQRKEEPTQDELCVQEQPTAPKPQQKTTESAPVTEKPIPLQSVPTISKPTGGSEDKRLTELIAERDVLIQQKAHLASQLTALRKRSTGVSYRPAETSGTSAVHQRQIEEFQRRITTLESTQRETAQDLTREKEARAKAEKLLIAAEKLQEQSANYMETAKAEMRREVEASMRPREAEARKIQKELQEQVFSLTEQNRKLLEELAGREASVGEDSAQAAASQAAFNAQVIRQLQSDVEDYRGRLDAVLKERDRARSEARSFANKEAALGSTLLSSDELAGLRKEIDVLSQRNSSLLGELEIERAKLQDEKVTTAARLRDDTCALEQQLAQAVRERDAAIAENSKVLADAQEDLAQRDQLLTALEKDHTTIVCEKEDLARRVAELEREAARKQKALRDASTDGLLGDPALHTEVATLRSALREAESRTSRLKEDSSREKQDLEVALEDARTSVARAQAAEELSNREFEKRGSELSALQSERDVLAQQRDELLRRINHITEEHKRLMESLSTDPRVLPKPGAEEEPPMNVIEVPLPEVLPPEPGTGVKVPMARPVAVPPPKIRTL